MIGNHYKELIHLLPDIVYKIDIKGNFVYLNEAVKNLGYEPSELLGRHFSIIIHPDDLKDVQRNIAIKKIKKNKKPARHHPNLFDERRTGKRITKKLVICLIPKNWDEKPGIFKRKENIWELLSLGLYTEIDDNKKIFEGSIGLIKDIRNIVKTEEVLSSIIKHYEVLSENSSDLVKLIANDGTILFASSSSKRILGYSSVDIIGNNIFDYIEMEDYDKFVKSLKKEYAEDDKISFVSEIHFRHENGSLLVLEITGKKIVDAKTKLMCYILNSRDVTERNKMIEELIHTKKIDSIRVLAGGIAHDFNNLLTSIIGNISMAKIKMDNNDNSYDNLVAAEKASLKAKDLTQQLLTFSKGGLPIKKITSIKNLIEETVHFVMSGSHITTELKIEDNLLNANCDEGQISQLIHNLILNSTQAMPEGGVITIKAKNFHHNSESGLPLEKGKFIIISINDEGKGILKKNIAKIFDPFFSTKDKGSGLGLSVAYSIIKKHNGYINVESEINKGSTFEIYLPATNKETIEDKNISTNIKFKGGKILLMDDDDMIREVCAKMLQSFGYTVTPAKDGRETIKLYKNAKDKGDPYNLVILDLTIPGGMGGKETISILKGFDPHIKAIVSSGYSNDPVMSNFKKYGFCGVTAKPYRLKELEEVLMEIDGS